MDARVIRVGNKADVALRNTIEFAQLNQFVLIAAVEKKNLENLKNELLNTVLNKEVKSGSLIVTNLRHYNSLSQTRDALTRVIHGIETGLTGDLIAQDIRQALHFLGELTGTITTDDLLGNIFSKFCIGK